MGLSLGSVGSYGAPSGQVFDAAHAWGISLSLSLSLYLYIYIYIHVYIYIYIYVCVCIYIERESKKAMRAGSATMGMVRCEMEMLRTLHATQIYLGNPGIVLLLNTAND